MENPQHTDSGSHEPVNATPENPSEAPAYAVPQAAPSSQYEWQRPDFETDVSENRPLWLIPIAAVIVLATFLFFRQRRKKQGLAAIKQQIEHTAGDISELVDLEQTLKDLEKATGKSRKFLQRFMKDAGKQMEEIDLEKSKKDLVKAQGKSQKFLNQFMKEAGHQLEDLQGQVDVKQSKKELKKAQGKSQKVLKRFVKDAGKQIGDLQGQVDLDQTKKDLAKAQSKYGKFLKAFIEEAQQQLGDLAEQRRQAMNKVADSGQEALGQLQDLQDTASGGLSKEQEKLDLVGEVRDRLARLEEKVGDLGGQVHDRYDNLNLDMEIARKRGELKVLETKRQAHALSDFAHN